MSGQDALTAVATVVNVVQCNTSWWPMSRRSVNLVLAASLLAWSSGLLLGLHIHQAGESHDSRHCEQCLLLLTTSPAMIASRESPGITHHLPRFEAVELESVILVRPSDPGFASRAPPAC